MSERPNVYGEASYDAEDPAGFRGAEVLAAGQRVGAAAGGKQLAVRAFELPPGESLCPYHYEFVEEWLLLLDGELDLRTPAGTERIARGALACFPSGPEGAHRVSTPAEQTVPSRFVMFSDGTEPAVAIYPDSDKIGVYLPGGTGSMVIPRSTPQPGYYDGER